MDCSSFENIPRFKPQEKDAEFYFPWVNCTAGEDSLQQKYALLARLGIPLGNTVADRNCRANVLQSLIDFEETVNHRTSHPLAGYNSKGKAQLVKIPTLVDKPTKTDYEKLRPLISTKKGGTSRPIDHILEALRTPSMSIEDAAGLLCLLLCKQFTTEYLQRVELAQEIEKKRLKKEKKGYLQPIIPEEIPMYDGCSRDFPELAMWNVRYHELLQYKERHGDVMVPSKKSKDYNAETMYNLAGWVAHMRTNYKNNNLSAKRIELLEAVGFKWVVNPDHYSALSDPRFHRAVALKLFLESVTAHDAMIVSGFEEEDASNDSRKKLLNSNVSNLLAKEDDNVDDDDDDVKKKKSKKSYKIEPAVNEILQTLRAADPDTTALWNVLLEVYGGESEQLLALRDQGKLIPRAHPQGTASSLVAGEHHHHHRHAPPAAKKQRTHQESSTPTTSSTASTTPRQHQQQQRRLPLAFLKDDYSAGSPTTARL